MLLLASSDSAAHAVVHSLREADIEASTGQRLGGFPVSVKVAESREPEALEIARKVDPEIRKQ